MLKVRVWEREALDNHKDGSTFPVLLISDMVEGPNGPVAIVTTCGNLTERNAPSNNSSTILYTIL